MKNLVTNYSGNSFDRFYGLDILLENCKGKTVLDIGNSDGLVTYEFARNGAAACHGVDYDAERVKFCQRLFSGVPVNKNFKRMDLSNINSRRYLNEAGFFSKYNIVLFLAVYQKIEYMGQTYMNNLMKFIESKTNDYLAIRTNSQQGIDYRPENFELIQSHDWYNGVGPLNIFKRVNNVS